MARNLKALGLALAAVLALGAVSASGASAQKLTSTTSPVKLLGKQTVGGLNALTVTGDRTVCPTAFYTGDKIATTPHVEIPTPATEITVTPHYEVCTEHPAGFPVTIDMNGCDYTFKLGATTGGVAHTYGVTMGVVCAAGKDIVVTVMTGSPHTVWCQVTIEYEPGVHYHGLHATDLTNDHLRIHGTMTGFKTITSRPPNHASILPCPTVTHKPTDAEPPQMHLDITVESSRPGNNLALSHP